MGLVVLLFRAPALEAGRRTRAARSAAAVERGEPPPAPTFALERLDEAGALDLAGLRGKPVVLNFWASWCDPCKEEAPYLEQVWRANRPRGLTVVGLDANDFRRDAAPSCAGSISRFRLCTTVPGRLSPAYGVTGFPETFVIDREGRVVEAFVGAVNSDEDRARLRARSTRRARRESARPRLAVACSASSVGASSTPPNAADLEAEFVCPVCKTTLDQSNAPVAER